MKTQLTAYSFDITQPEQAEEYLALCKILNETRKCFNVLKKSRIPNQVTREITINTNCIFNNQWNTEDNQRVHDWFEGIYPNKSIKSGYYLAITQEMIDLKDNILQCGYCGKQYTDQLLIHCVNCASSEYLEDNQLHLLELAFVSGKMRDMPEEVLAISLKRLKESIENAKEDRRLLRIKTLKSSLVAAKEQLDLEYDGFLWLAENKIDHTNCIYYNHTATFCFGWKDSLSREQIKELQTLTQGFPFNVSFK